MGNNPILDTLTEIEEWNMAVRSKGRESEVFTPTVVVSLGCGKPPVMLVSHVDCILLFHCYYEGSLIITPALIVKLYDTKKEHTVLRFMQHSPSTQVDTVDVTIPSLLDVRRGLQAMYNLFNVLVEQACSSEGRVTDRARAWCSSLHVPFFRFNPQLSQDIALDEHDDECLMRMMWETRAYMKSQAKVLAQLKPHLVETETGPLPTPTRARRGSHAQRKSSVDAPDTPHKLLSEGNSPEEEVSFHSTLPDYHLESSERVLPEESSPDHPATPEPPTTPDYVSSSEAPCSSPDEACDGSEKTSSSESPIEPTNSNVS